MDSLLPARLTINQERLLQYADLSNDFNPIHTDPAFAAATPLGGIIAHGTLSVTLLLESIELTFGTSRPLDYVLDVRFKRPVRIGDQVEAGGERQPDGSFTLWVRNQHGEAVIEGSARFD
jgi:3-hydroxybutyryl-CoA dehydratase